MTVFEFMSMGIPDFVSYLKRTGPAELVDYRFCASLKRARLTPWQQKKLRKEALQVLQTI